MANIIVPQRRVWTRQPQGPVDLNWCNPITNSLICAYTNGTDACARVSANTAQRAISVAGRCDQYTGATSDGTTYVELGNSLGPTGPFTFVLWLWSDSELGGLDSAISQGDYAAYRTKDSEFYTYNGGWWDAVQVGGARGYRGVGLYKVVCVHTGSQNIIYSETPSLGRRVDFNSCSPRSSPVNYPIRLGADAQNGRCLPGKIFVAHTLKRAVLASEARGLLENPWQIFRPRPRRTIIETSTGNTYIISSTGSIIFSGSSTQLYNKVFATTGTLNLLGTNNLVFSNGATTYVIIPSGSIEINGTGQYNKENLLIPQGSISYSGSSPQRRTNTLLPTGELTFSGNSNFGKVKVVSITGTILFNGTAQIYMPGMEVDTTSILLTGVGK